PPKAGRSIPELVGGSQTAKAHESIAKSRPVRPRPKRRAPQRRRKAKRRDPAGTELLRQQRLQLEREKFEWSKNRDLWNGLKWFLEYSRSSEYDDENYDD